MQKTYTIQQNIGKARHVVSFHNGEKKHSDGSPFFDLRVFSNKKKRDVFVTQLRADGYAPK